MIYAIDDDRPVCNAAVVVVNATTCPYWIRGLWWCADRKCGRTGRNGGLLSEDEARIEERVRTYAGALHKRVLERVMHKAKQGGHLDPGGKRLDWIGPAWVEYNYARELESLLCDDRRIG